MTPSLASRQHDLLKRLEWSTWLVNDSEGCGICLNRGRQGHTTDCELGAILTTYDIEETKRKLIAGDDWVELKEPFTLTGDNWAELAAILKEGEHV